MIETVTNWRTEYTYHDREADIELRVYNPNDMSWFWAAYDLVTEESCVSMLPGFDTKEQAMEAAKNYLAEWQAKVRETGEREM